MPLCLVIGLVLVVVRLVLRFPDGDAWKIDATAQVRRGEESEALGKKQSHSDNRESTIGCG